MITNKFPDGFLWGHLQVRFRSKEAAMKAKRAWLQQIWVYISQV
ncbi:hypothetical protein C823_001741 [Eubacterium plexicaudatum ASF492]|nr:hypothetical protein C823_001741 [Eubacterium plexicaudatum ASF492]